MFPESTAGQLGRLLSSVGPCRGNDCIGDAAQASTGWLGGRRSVLDELLCVAGGDEGKTALASRQRRLTIWEAQARQLWMEDNPRR